MDNYGIRVWGKEVRGKIILPATGGMFFQTVASVMVTPPP